MHTVLYLLSKLFRLSVFVLRRLGSGGTSLPGLFVERFAPYVIAPFTRSYDLVIVITGTNGKTTTQEAMGTILQNAGYSIVRNASGSNMFRGIATTVITAGTSSVKAQKRALVLEVEEATTPRLAEFIQPHIVIITNFYRDQLDAYGEVYTTVGYVKSAVARWSSATLVVNADDPLVRSLCAGLDSPRVVSGYSLGAHATHFAYESSHGHSPTIQSAMSVTKVEQRDDFSTTIEIDSAGTTLTCTIPLAGLYNVYNICAALSAARCIDIDLASASSAVASMSAPFGRGEALSVVLPSGKRIDYRIFLVKNPAGLTQVWRMVCQSSTSADSIFALNDRIADGRDVSWIWDAVMEEKHSATRGSVWATGMRAYDMALRLKLSGAPIRNEAIVKNMSKCIKTYHATVDAETPDRRSCLVLATYTAMNEIRDVLAEFTTVHKFQTTKHL